MKKKRVKIAEILLSSHLIEVDPAWIDPFLKDYLGHASHRVFLTKESSLRVKKFANQARSMPPEKPRPPGDCSGFKVFDLLINDENIDGALEKFREIISYDIYQKQVDGGDQLDDLVHHCTDLLFQALKAE